MNPLSWPAQDPVELPEPTGDSVSALEEGFRDGDARSDPGVTTFQRVPFYIDQGGSSFPFQVPAGTPRPAMHPAGPAGTLNGAAADWNHQGGSEGLHGELYPAAAFADPGHQQTWGVQPRTWRAEPEPWDAAAYQGWVPQPMGDG